MPVVLKDVNIDNLYKYLKIKNEDFKKSSEEFRTDIKNDPTAIDRIWEYLDKTNIDFNIDKETFKNDMLIDVEKPEPTYPENAEELAKKWREEGGGEQIPHPSIPGTPAEHIVPPEELRTPQPEKEIPQPGEPQFEIPEPKFEIPEAEGVFGKALDETGYEEPADALSWVELIPEDGEINHIAEIAGMLSRYQEGQPYDEIESLEGLEDVGIPVTREAPEATIGTAIGKGGIEGLRDMGKMLKFMSGIAILGDWYGKAQTAEYRLKWWKKNIKEQTEGHAGYEQSAREIKKLNNIIKIKTKFYRGQHDLEEVKGLLNKDEFEQFKKEKKQFLKKLSEQLEWEKLRKEGRTKMDIASTLTRMPFFLTRLSVLSSATGLSGGGLLALDSFINTMPGVVQGEVSYADAAIDMAASGLIGELFKLAKLGKYKAMHKLLAKVKGGATVSGKVGEQVVRAPGEAGVLGYTHRVGGVDVTKFVGKKLFPFGRKYAPEIINAASWAGVEAPTLFVGGTGISYLSQTVKEKVKKLEEGKTEVKEGQSIWEAKGYATYEDYLYGELKKEKRRNEKKWINAMGTGGAITLFSLRGFKRDLMHLRKLDASLTDLESAVKTLVKKNNFKEPKGLYNAIRRVKLNQSKYGSLDKAFQHLPNKYHEILRKFQWLNAKRPFKYRYKPALPGTEAKQPPPSGEGRFNMTDDVDVKPSNSAYSGKLSKPLLIIAPSVKYSKQIAGFKPIESANFYINNLSLELENMRKNDVKKFEKKMIDDNIGVFFADNLKEMSDDLQSDKSEITDLMNKGKSEITEVGEKYNTVESPNYALAFYKLKDDAYKFSLYKKTKTGDELVLTTLGKTPAETFPVDSQVDVLFQQAFEEGDFAPEEAETGAPDYSVKLVEDGYRWTDVNGNSGIVKFSEFEDDPVLGSAKERAFGEANSKAQATEAPEETKQPTEVSEKTTEIESAFSKHYRNNEIINKDIVPKKIINLLPGYALENEKIYRGVKKGEDEKGLNWTTDKLTAEANAGEEGKTISMSIDEFKEKYDFVAMDEIDKYLGSLNRADKGYVSESEIVILSEKSVPPKVTENVPQKQLDQDYKELKKAGKVDWDEFWDSRDYDKDVKEQVQKDFAKYLIEKKQPSRHLARDKQIPYELIAGEEYYPKWDEKSIKLKKKKADKALKPVTKGAYGGRAPDVFNAIYYDFENQVKVATDGTMIVVTPTTVPSNSKGKNSRPVEGGKSLTSNYPEWSSVIPVNGLASDVNDIGLAVSLYGDMAKSRNVVSEDGFYLLLDLDGNEVLFNPEKLYKVTKALGELGTKKFRFEVSETNPDKEGLILRDVDNPEQFGLVMPISADVSKYPHTRQTIYLGTNDRIDEIADLHRKYIEHAIDKKEDGDVYEREVEIDKELEVFEKNLEATKHFIQDTEKAEKSPERELPPEVKVISQNSEEVANLRSFDAPVAKYVDNSHGKFQEWMFTETEKGKPVIWRQTKWAEWFRSNSRGSKPRIVRDIEESKPELRNWGLSFLYDTWKNKTGSDISFKEFLDKPIKLYRGITTKDKAKGRAGAFDSYFISKIHANQFGAGDEIEELTIKPGDTYGSFNVIGNEFEVLVPTKLPPEHFRERITDLINNRVDAVSNDIGKVLEKYFPNYNKDWDNENYELLYRDIKNFLYYKRPDLLKEEYRPPVEGSEYSVVAPTYKAGVEMAVESPHDEANILIEPPSMLPRDSKNLMIQFNSGLVSQGQDVGSEYYDKLYSGNRIGYMRPGEGKVASPDFWEIPTWMALAKHNLGDKVNEFVVRNMENAKAFLENLDYGSVSFSVMDVNKDFVKELIDYIPDNVTVDIGGYIKNPAKFFDVKNHPNVKIHKNMKEFVESKGEVYKEGYDYSTFKNTDTVPRLALSHGCLYHCVFCNVEPHGKVKSLPQHAIDRQVQEIIDLDFNLVYLNDKTFGQSDNYKQLPEIYNKIKDANPYFQGFVIQTTPIDMQSKNFSKDFLAKSGIRYVELGIETYNEGILRAFHKPASIESINNAVDWIRENNLSFIPNVIIGGHWTEEMAKKTVEKYGDELTDEQIHIINSLEETPESYKNTLQFLQDNEDIISHINIYNFAPYANTLIGQEQEGVIDKDLLENITEKSFHKNPIAHKNGYETMVGFGERMLDTYPIKEVSAKEFNKAIDKAFDNTRLSEHKDEMTRHSNKELIGMGATLYLTHDGTAGFGITEDGEGVNLFSVHPGRGKYLFQEQIAKWMTHLNATEGYLTDLYSEYFELDRKEPNHIEGESPIWYMTVQSDAVDRIKNERRLTHEKEQFRITGNQRGLGQKTRGEVREKTQEETGQGVEVPPGERTDRYGATEKKTAEGTEKKELDYDELEKLPKQLYKVAAVSDDYAQFLEKMLSQNIDVDVAEQEASELGYSLNEFYEAAFKKERAKAHDLTRKKQKFIRDDNPSAKEAIRRTREKDKKSAEAVKEKDKAIEEEYKKGLKREKETGDTPTLGNAINFTRNMPDVGGEETEKPTDEVGGGKYKPPVKKKGRPKFYFKLPQFFQDVYDGVRKIFFHPGTPNAFKVAVRKDLLGKINKGKRVVIHQIYLSVMGGLREDEVRDAMQLIVARDQYASAKYNRGNPEMSEEEAKKILDKIEGEAADNILEAGEAYRRIMKKYTEVLIDKGLLKEDDVIPDYFRHYVIDYTPAWQFYQGIPTRLKRTFKGYLQEREGSEKEYMKDVQAMLGMFLQMENDIVVDDFVTNQCEKWDITDRIPDHILDDLEPKPGRWIDGSVIGEPNNDYRVYSPDPSYLRGNRRIYILPKNLWNTFTDFSTKTSTLMFGANQAVRWWKTMAILSNYIPFNVHNMFGDSWMAFTYTHDRMALIHNLPRIIKYFIDQKTLPGYHKWIEEQDVIGSMFIEQEMVALQKTTSPSAHIYKKLRQFSEYREALLRLANALTIYEDMQNGKAAEVAAKYSHVNTDGLSEEDAMGEISRQFLIDYTRFSKEFNKWIRNLAMPFSPFYFKGSEEYWKRMFSKNWYKPLLGTIAPIALATIWNHLTEERRKIERQLPEWVREITHIVIGENDDGTIKVLTFQMPYDLFFGTKVFNIANTQALMVANGEKSLKEGASDVLEHWIDKEVKSVAYLLNPMVRYIQGLITDKDPYTGGHVYSPEARRNNKYPLKDMGLYLSRCWLPVAMRHVEAASQHEPMKAATKEALESWEGEGALGIYDINPETMLPAGHDKGATWDNVMEMSDLEYKKDAILAEVEKEYQKFGSLDPRPFVESEKFDMFMPKLRDFYERINPKVKGWDDNQLKGYILSHMTSYFGMSVRSRKAFWKVQKKLGDESKYTPEKIAKETRKLNAAILLKGLKQTNDDVQNLYLSNPENLDKYIKQ